MTDGRSSNKCVNPISPNEFETHVWKQSLKRTTTRAYRVSVLQSEKGSGVFS